MNPRNLIACGAVVITGLAASAAQPVSTAPALDQVRNAAVRELIQGQIVQLKNGVYEGPPFTRGGSERPSITLIEKFTATGNIDASPLDERVVLLKYDAGTAGVKLYLAAYGFKGERVANLSTVLVGGDRAQPTVLAITGSQIVVEVTEAGRQSRKVFRLGGRGLESVPVP